LVEYPDTVFINTLVEVTVNPCPVTKYLSSVFPTNEEYTIGEGPRIMGVYAFSQVQDCGYAQSYSVTSLPSFIIHDPVLNNFAVNTYSLSNEQSLSVTVISSITVPADYTGLTFNDIEHEFTFTFVIINPCRTTVLEAFTMPDISLHVRQSPGVTETIPFVYDSADQEYSSGSGNLCGDRIYEIYSPSGGDISPVSISGN
jgi:hypothetical protein